MVGIRGLMRIYVFESLDLSNIGRTKTIFETVCKEDDDTGS